MDRWSYAFQDPTRVRRKVYEEVLQMDNTIEEVAAALDILADNAVHGEAGEAESFQIVYEVGANIPDGVKAQIDGVLARTRWREKAFQYAREMLLFGDVFLERVFNRNLELVRLMYLPPETMIRREDSSGLLYQGNGEEDAAFVQQDPDKQQVLARFYPWQVEHIRWGRSGSSKYGRSLLYTARTAWVKLRAMEEALVINWLTRAFARLLFILDVTGKTSDEASRYIKDFRSALQTQRIGGGNAQATQLSVVKDVYIGKRYQEIGDEIREGLADVKVLDTSNSAYLNLAAIEYYRGKILTATRVPKAHLGLEKDINAKATLQLEDRRFGKTIQRIQTVLSEAIMNTINIQLIAFGVDPATVPYRISWPTPSWADEVDTSTYYRNVARSAEELIPLGVLDAEYVATRMLKITPQEWSSMKGRQTNAIPKGDGTEEVEG